MSEPPIVVERELAAPPARVWSAITDPREMPKWFFEGIREFRPEIGSETRFDVSNDGKTYPHHWRVTAATPEKTITYDWLYDGTPGASFVTWELTPTSGGTKLRLTHTNGWTFPQDDPAFQRANCEGGWNYFLDRLAKYLAG
jgi:uncharacterized protein YndB with AHSA1/START domain